MTDATYVVDVDLEQLRAHRSKAEHRDLTRDEVKIWLARLGFYPRIDGLYVAERDVLRKLHPTEIRQARVVGNILH
jgi:hypothetical protein